MFFYFSMQIRFRAMTWKMINRDFMAKYRSFNAETGRST